MEKCTNRYKIRHLKRDEINNEKWNRCVLNSFTPSVYGLIWYLNICSNQWDGLVMGDYLAVMPVPLINKYGFKLAINPYFIQKLGVFSTISLSYKEINRFYKLFPSKFILMNIFTTSLPNIGIKKTSFRPNYELNLKCKYKTTYANYSSHTKYNVRRSYKEQLTVTTTANTDWFISFSNLNRRFILPNREKERLKKIINTSLKMETGEILTVLSPEGNVIAAVFILKIHKRVYYHTPVSNDDGYNKRALYFLMDYIIKKQSERDVTIDFEGSRVKNIARFFKGFGGKNKYYSHLFMFKL